MSACERIPRAPSRHNLLAGRSAEEVAGIEARLLAKISPEPNTGCHLWTGAATSDGYGKIGLGPVGDQPKSVVYTHRLAFELAHGPIPEGLTVDHRCLVRSCANAAHLEAVTHQENCARRPDESYWGTRQSRARRAA